MAEEEKDLTEDDSMEDILHSIRDIIADGEESTDQTGEEVVELTEVVKESDAPSEDVLDDIDAALEGSEEAPAEPEAETTPEAETPAEKTTPPADPTEALVDNTTAAASAAAMQDLVQNIPRAEIERKDFRSGNTVEDLALEALRPMLKEWLDNNLENIVREIVEREIRKLLPRE